MTDTTSAQLSRLARLIAGDGHGQGLQPVQLQTLRYLALANRFSRTPGALTAWLGQTKGTVSQTIATLERRKLVQRSADLRDRRIVRIELTAAGRAVLDSTSDIAGAMLARLDAAERDSVAQWVGRMLTGHIAAHGQRAMGICNSCRHFRPAIMDGGTHQCMLLGVPLDDGDAASLCIEQEAA